MKKGLILLYFLIIFAMIGGILFFLNNYSVKIEKKNEIEPVNEVVKPEIKVENEELDIESDFVEKLYSSVDGNYYYMLSYDKMKSGEIPNDVKLRLAWAEVSKKGHELSAEEIEKTGNTYYYDVEDFRTSINKIFGENTEFENETFSVSEFDGHPDVVYNKEKNRYETNFEYGGAIGGYIKTYVKSAIKEGDYVSVVVNPLYFKAAGDTESGEDLDEKFDVYANYDFETDQFVNKLLDANDSKYDEKIDSIIKENSSLEAFKYVFKKEGNNYYFDSFEKIENAEIKNDEETANSDGTKENERISAIEELEKLSKKSEEPKEINQNREEPEKVYMERYEVIGQIEIPKTNCNYPILDGVEKRSLELAIGRVPYGPGLNGVGNTILFGMNYLNGMFFSNNKDLEEGDLIYITDKYGDKITYEVYKTYITNANDAEYFTRDTEGRRELSLQTVTDDGQKRLIIWAKEKEE